MPTTINPMFFLGNFADMDTDEANDDAESPGLPLGTYIQPDLIDIAVNDGDGNGIIWDDENGTVAGEDVTYDTGSGPVTQFIDSTIVYNVQLTLGDGSTTNITATAIQTQNGDVFLTDFANNGSLDNLAVQNIELLSVFGSNYTGFYADSSVDNTRVVCFAAGTMILTQTGVQPVEEVTPDTQVWTLDNGYQPCRAITVQRLSRPGPKHAPIRISAGALGYGVPEVTLSLSPQHRVLVSSPVAKRMFGTREVLAPAKDLLGIAGVTKALPFLPVEYHHLVFENHEILTASGLLTESYFSGIEARKAMPDAFELHRDMIPARPFVKGQRARKMVDRHQKNCAPRGKPLCPAPDLPLNAGIGAFAGQNTFETARFI